jgi:hypothetical protein
MLDRNAINFRLPAFPAPLQTDLRYLPVTQKNIRDHPTKGLPSPNDALD